MQNNNINKVQIFTHEKFGEIRTIIINNEPWFVGKDVAKALGYKKPENAIKSHINVEDKTTTLIQGSGNYKSKTTIINESGLYSLILSSKLDSAKKFKHWITSEVLPSIRKHGGYIAGQDDMTDIELLAKAVLLSDSIIKEKNKKIEEQSQKLLEQQPLVDFAEHVSKSSDLIDISLMAKILHDEGIDIGRNKLYSYLRQNKILMKNNIPYQRFINEGYFKVVEKCFITAYGEKKIYNQTFVTGKGQIYITEKCRKLFKTA